MFHQRQLKINNVACDIKSCLDKLNTVSINDIVDGYLNSDMFNILRTSTLYNCPIFPRDPPSADNFMRLKSYFDATYHPTEYEAKMANLSYRPQKVSATNESPKLWDLVVRCDITDNFELFESFHEYLKKTVGNKEIKDWFSQDTKSTSRKQTSNKKDVKEKQPKTASEDEQATPSSSKAKKTRIPATVKRLIWNKHIGEEIGKSKCLCCKVTDITQMSFNCGHIISEKNGGDVKVANLLPVCQNCNSSMGTMNMDEFKAKHGI